MLHGCCGRFEVDQVLELGICDRSLKGRRHRVEYILRCGLDITHRANNRVVVVLTMLSHKGEDSGVVCRASSQFEVITKKAVTAIF